MKLLRITHIALATTLFAASAVVGCGGTADSPQSPQMPQVPQMPGQPQVPITNGAPNSPAPPLAPPAPPPPPVDIPATLTLSPAGREALQTVMSASAFGGWAVGAAGTPTMPVAAFRILLAEPNAREAFAFGVTHGSLAGQLTALSGLFFTDPPRFRTELARFRGRQETVRLMTSGCDPGGDVVVAATIVEAPNSVQLTGPDDSLSAWSTRNPGRQIAFDIAGGSYPIVLRGNR